MIVGFALGFVDGLLRLHGLLPNIVNLALFVPWLAATVRRLHDADRSGWWLLGLLVAFITFVVLFAAFSGTGFPKTTAASFTMGIGAILIVLVGLITWLVFMVLPGTEGPNRFGPDPYGPDTLEEVFA